MRPTPKTSKLVSTMEEKEMVLLIMLDAPENIFFVEAYSSDTIAVIHLVLESRTGIPVVEQELYFNDKKLPAGNTLEECFIVRMPKLKLVDRRHIADIKENPEHGKAWRSLHNFMCLLDMVCTEGHEEEEEEEHMDYTKYALSHYLEGMPRDDEEKADKYLKIFYCSSALSRLMAICRSDSVHHMLCALKLILKLLKWFKKLPENLQFLSAPILKQLCSNLSQSSHELDLNYVCRSLLRNVIGYMTLSNTPETATDISLKDLSIILDDVVSKICSSLIDDGNLTTNPHPFSPLRVDVEDFKQIMLLMKSLRYQDLTQYKKKDIEGLCRIFSNLFEKMGFSLSKVVEMLQGSINEGSCNHIVILHEIQIVTQLFPVIKDEFWMMLRHQKLPFCYLLIKYSVRGENYEWVLEHKEVTTSECRRHLVLLLFPEVNNYAELSTWKINRAQVFEQSFEYVNATPKHTLRAGLPIQFLDEVAKGPGVVREWFCLVCEALFDPQKELFVACPHDLKRFMPNSASTSDPQYFEFAGRMVALALMHKVAIGVRLDQVLVLQLAERCVSLEDIRDADPTSYRNYKYILEMDAEAVDKDVLVLRFYVEEEDRSGPMRVVELVPNGQNIVVNSTNIRKYVDLLIQHRYVKSIEVHVSRFAKGFSDIINSSRRRILFFESLELEDFNGLLCGSEKPVSVEEWRAHTDYNGYQETDSQIAWFWEIVGDMSAEQKSSLLFLWTAVKHLPIQGFGGLSSRLFIYTSGTSSRHFPSSSTCCFCLYLPLYPSFEAMKERLQVISLKHNSYGFGNV